LAQFDSIFKRRQFSQHSNLGLRFANFAFQFGNIRSWKCELVALRFCHSSTNNGLGFSFSVIACVNNNSRIVANERASETVCNPVVLREITTRDPDEDKAEQSVLFEEPQESNVLCQLCEYCIVFTICRYNHTDWIAFQGDAMYNRQQRSMSIGANHSRVPVFLISHQLLVLKQDLEDAAVADLGRNLFAAGILVPDH
jgi:hypothetical protein